MYDIGVARIFDWGCPFLLCKLSNLRLNFLFSVSITSKPCLHSTASVHDVGAWTVHCGWTPSLPALRWLCCRRFFQQPLTVMLLCVSSLEGSAFVKYRVCGKKKKMTGVPDNIRLHQGNHFPVQTSTFRRCRLCSSRTNNKSSRIICGQCNVSLCVTPCFGIFHKHWL